MKTYRMTRAAREGLVGVGAAGSDAGRPPLLADVCPRHLDEAGMAEVIDAGLAYVDGPRGAEVVVLSAAGQAVYEAWRADVLMAGHYDPA